MNIASFFFPPPPFILCIAREIEIDIDIKSDLDLDLDIDIRTRDFQRKGREERGEELYV